MLRAFSLVLLVSACIAGEAQAQVADVPRPYAIPLPPLSNPEPQWDLGIRYWYSEGSSTLTSDDQDGNSLEFVFAVRNETRTFFKGFVGGGWLNGGSTDVRFMDFSSDVDGEGLVFGTMDVGQDFKLLDTGTRVVFSPFVGFNYWEETLDAFGARCETGSVDGLPCTPGSLLIPFSEQSASGEVSWSSLRLGAELTAKFSDRLTLRADAAILPVAYLSTDVRNLVPRAIGRTAEATGDSGPGWGYQLEGEVRLDVTDHWAFGAGVRYWYAETNSYTDLGLTDVRDFSSDRFGVFGNATYRFNTY
ncbi:MAG: autotransporter outer membrane beta-barrel domain-containing protein [Methyloceanibacter sp.]|uniref:autotransporter outer membrane beta-barrel domain-containing protein n=1 Tax=Methyloceanibacter sp. TaxID=1965321 RepID=UPI003EE16494